ncbi:hypothetical protein Efla_003137 [Eimeria flavescens]
MNQRPIKRTAQERKFAASLTGQMKAYQTKPGQQAPVCYRPLCMQGCERQQQQQMGLWERGKKAVSQTEESDSDCLLTNASEVRQLVCLSRAHSKNSGRRCRGREGEEKTALSTTKEEAAAPLLLPIDRAVLPALHQAVRSGPAGRAAWKERRRKKSRAGEERLHAERWSASVTRKKGGRFCSSRAATAAAAAHAEAAALVGPLRL